MKNKNLFSKLKQIISTKEKLISIISLVFTLLFSIYNRIIGAIRESLWHEAISIYYFVLVTIKFIILIYIMKSKTTDKDVLVFKIVKVLLIVLNILLIVPITLMIFNKRIVEMSFVFSIVIAVYVTFKTTKSIINYVKKRKEDTLTKELKVIDLTDCVVSILTLQNTLISVNSNGFDEGLYHLTIISSFIGFAFNVFIVSTLKPVLNKRQTIEQTESVDR